MHTQNACDIDRGAKRVTLEDGHWARCGAIWLQSGGMHDQDGLSEDLRRCAFLLV